MKRKTLTTAVLAGLTGMAGMVSVSNAVNVNPDGLGQVLLYPYYSVRGNNDTLISVVNTTDQAKAVKVRFLEALNSEEVLDFNLYLSAFDVWVAAITVTEAGGGKIIIPDRSCTVPYLFATTGGDDFGEQNFLPFAFAGDPGPQEITRTASGHVEIIEMGTLVNDEEGSATAATHVDGVPPESGSPERVCGQLEDAWTPGHPNAYWLTDASTDIEPPSGGLFGGGSIINVDDGTMFTYNAVAIDGFSTVHLHRNPGTEAPDLRDGNVATSFVFDNGVLEQDEWDEENTLEAVNAVLMFERLFNEYVTGGDAAARSEWVVTFPTKRFHVTAVDEDDEAQLPFTSTFGADGACEQVRFRFWDREEQTPTPELPPLLVSPPPPDPEVPQFDLCWEANVIRFGDAVDATTFGPTEILKDPRFLNIATEGAGFTSGWMRFQFSEANFQDSQSGATNGVARGARRYHGLPVIGFWVNTFTNETLEVDGLTVLANYGGSFQHRGSRLIATS